MGRLRIAAMMLAVITPLTGCSALADQLIRESPTSTSLVPARQVLSQDAVATLARPSVVKVRGRAESCQRLLEGTGFVVGPTKVLTNAHVVAGTEKVTVDADGTDFDAHVVSYDSNIDVAILDVPGMAARPLGFASSPAPAGTKALVMGYPNGGPFAVLPARVDEIIDLKGPDIYRTTTVTRQAYLVNLGGAKDFAGVSGGPLIDMEGRVLGMFFGAQVDHPDTGFALAEAQLAPHLAMIGNTQPVPTGACVS
jgi:S1-C subfamily serine protease